MPTLLSSERDRAVLRSFASRIDRGDAGAHNNLGVLYFNKGMVAEAVSAFTRALDLDPRMTIAQRNLEIAYFTSGYYDERVAALLDRLARAPNDGAARWELGRTYALLGEPGLAVDQFAALVRDDPTDVRAMQQLALSEAKRGEPESATRWLQHALELEPHHAALHFQLGEVCYHRGLNDDALAHLQRAIELAPDDADSHYLLGFVLGDIGCHEDARVATRRAFQLNPSLGRAHANLSLERFDARSYERAREAREARGLADRLEVAEDGQLAHYNLGLAFRQKGYLAEALREYQLALERGEDRTLVLQAMAEVHLLRRESAAAVQLYDSVLAELPHSPKLWNERGVALHQEGKSAEARLSYERAVVEDPNYALARNNLAVALAHEGDRDRALAELRRVIASEATFRKGQLNLALLLFRSGEHASALESYGAVLASSPADPVALNGLGLVHMQLQQLEDARNAFARAVEARDEYAEAHYNLGFVLSALGDHAGSLRETKRALEIDPYYAPQRFELAVDLEFEDPRFEIAADLGGDVKREVLEGFAFEEQALDALFGDEDATPARRACAPLDASAAGLPVDRDPYRSALDASQRGDHDGALAEIRRLMSAGAPRVDGLVATGMVFEHQGAIGEAVDRYREALVQQPDRREAIAGTLRTLVALGRYREATTAAAAVAAWTDADATLLIVAATVLAETDRIEDALTLMERAQRADGENPVVLQGIGDLARAMGDEAGAVEAYRAALTIDGGFAAVRMQLAALLRRQGRQLEAESELDAALRELPTYADAALALAALRRELGRPGEAIPVLIPILEGNPWHLDALASLGESLFQAGRREDARFAVARVLRFDAEHVAALYLDGVFLALERRYDAAIARWDRVLALEPVGDVATRARRDLRAASELQGVSTTSSRSWSDL